MKKRTRTNTVLGILAERGYTKRDLFETRTYEIKSLKAAFDFILNEAGKGKLIYVVADYDVDGVCAGTIMHLMLEKLKIRHEIRFPKRMSEGYGISMKILDTIPSEEEGVCIVTVDNGIAAVEVTEEAKRRGHSVVITDHHLVRDDGKITEADIVVDPHTDEDAVFADYCGTGIAYRMAALVQDKDLTEKALVLAAIATIQDVVPLVKENRTIVQKGLELLNADRNVLPGLKGLLKALYLHIPSSGMEKLTEEDVGFKIGPCMNAPGRLLDDGSKTVFEALTQPTEEVSDLIKKMVELNDRRKQLTADQQELIDADIEKRKKGKDACIIVYNEHFHEGINGINAARVVETYHAPCIIFTKTESGHLKGSGRSIPEINLKEALDSCADLLVGYGGHAGAAGITIEEERLSEFAEKMNGLPKFDAPEKEYDLEISSGEAELVLHEIRNYAPYGEGFPPIIVKVKDFVADPQFGAAYRTMGAGGMAFSDEHMEACTFDQLVRRTYMMYGRPFKFSMAGELQFSRFANKPQLMISDIEGRQEDDFFSDFGKDLLLS